MSRASDIFILLMRMTMSSYDLRCSSPTFSSVCASCSTISVLMMLRLSNNAHCALVRAKSSVKFLGLIRQSTAAVRSKPTQWAQGCNMFDCWLLSNRYHNRSMTAGSNQRIQAVPPLGCCRIDISAKCRATDSIDAFETNAPQNRWPNPSFNESADQSSTPVPNK